MASPDESTFDNLYSGLPSGLIVAACPSWKSFDTLQAFCASLKAASIRDGSTAMNFWWGYSRKNWKTTASFVADPRRSDAARAEGVYNASGRAWLLWRLKIAGISFKLAGSGFVAAVAVRHGVKTATRGTDPDYSSLAFKEP